MCGRFVSSTPVEQIAKEFHVDEVRAAPAPPDFNVAPRATINVVLDEAHDAAVDRVLEGLRWGLVPSWAKDLKVGDRMINARAETVATKSAFRRAFKHRRCIIPADAFYEWKVVAGQKRKQPMAIKRRDGELLAFAGLWERWRDPEEPDAEWIRSATIITGKPNEVIAPIHDRMPVILPESKWDEWLDPTFDDVEALEALLVSAPSELFEVYPVSTRVNNARDHSELLLERVETTEEQSLL